MVRRSLIPVFALALLAPWAQSAAIEAPRAVPRIGETMQEFQARTSGQAPAGQESGIVNVSADRKGHFFLDASLDGHPIRMVVDTGASVVALTYDDAERIGARVSESDFRLKMSTANGTVAGAAFRIGEVAVGDLRVRDVEAVVLPKGKLETSLLGMSFLKRLAGFDISRGRLSLRN